MAIQLSVDARNDRLDAFETTTGATAKLQIRSGAQPANCASAAAGTLIAEMTLPADWMNAAATGSKTLLGVWSVDAVAGATAAHFRIVDNAGTTCHMQGSVSITSGGGDMELDNDVIANGQTVTITTFTLTDANA